MNDREQASTCVRKRACKPSNSPVLAVLVEIPAVMSPYRPLSRRLDRCDRMIQNEGHDSRKLFTLKIALCR